MDIEGLFENACSSRRSSSRELPLVVRREVEQSSLRKLISPIRKAATEIGIRFQEITIHDVCPTQLYALICTARRLNPPKGHSVNSLLTVSFWGIYLRGTPLRAHETGCLSMHPRG